MKPSQSVTIDRTISTTSRSGPTRIASISPPPRLGERGRRDPPGAVRPLYPATPRPAGPVEDRVGRGHGTCSTGLPAARERELARGVGPRAAPERYAV